MRMLGNILWHFPFFGFVTAIFSFIIGGLFVLTIIGYPIGLGIIQLGRFYLAPFSYAMVDAKKLKAANLSGETKGRVSQVHGLWSTIIMILWIPFGAILAVFTVIGVVASFITIIGIPVALAAAKSLSTIFNPINKVCVHRAVADEVERRDAQLKVEKSLS